MSLSEYIASCFGIAFLIGFTIILIFGIVSMEKSEQKKREYLESKKRYYDNINVSLEKENESIKEIKK